MRVLLLTRYFPPVPGGNSTYAEELQRGLTQRGHEVTVFFAPRRDLRSEQLAEAVHMVPPPHFRPGSREYFEATVRAAVDLALRLGESWDVIHFQDAICAAAALALRERLAIPAVYTSGF
jgi:glycosyltransferase involved in cell wall biosynthesis